MIKPENTKFWGISPNPDLILLREMAACVLSVAVVGLHCGIAGGEIAT